MQHFHVGMDDKVLRCSTARTTAAKNINGLVHGIALDMEYRCSALSGRCGSCGWCKSADQVWDVFRTQVVMPIVRSVLGVGMTVIWEIEVPTGPSYVIWAGEAEGSYADCRAVDHAHLTAFTHVVV